QERDMGFTGRLGKVSAYKMRGHDKIVMRSRGGASKKQIKTSPDFESTRNLNSEWKAVTTASAEIRAGLYALKPLADYNTSGPLNAIVKKIQTADTDHPKGKRSILFSRQPDLLSGFSFNRKTLFDSVIRQPLSVTIDPSAAVAEVVIPALTPGINFFGNPRYAYYQFVLAFTAVSDYSFDEMSGKFNAVCPKIPDYRSVFTPWVPVNALQPSAAYRLAPDNTNPPVPGMTLVFGAGIQYGMPAPDGSIQPVPYSGSARILKSV
ncbi:MAG: hypothetical protein Q8918_19035, partial [Bacteroidota bacterium]|nr:hypothetical protein [Bacteroidota bacterium]